MVCDVNFYEKSSWTHSFTGGGYAIDGDRSHLKFWHSVQADISTAGISVAWLFVAYSLTPSRTYPTPICEGVEALRYVLDQKHRQPSEIIIGGDSAGASLSLALLSHLSHPCPEFPHLEITGKLKAIVLIAPWVSFRTDWPSNKRNEFKDYVSATIGNLWSNAYKDKRSSNNYIEAIEAPQNWWKDAQVEQLLCTAGEDEVLIDAISAWVQKYKVSAGDFTRLLGNPESLTTASSSL